MQLVKETRDKPEDNFKNILCLRSITSPTPRDILLHRSQISENIISALFYIQQYISHQKTVSPTFARNGNDETNQISFRSCHLISLINPKIV